MLGRLYLVVTPRPGWSLEATLDRTERALAGGVEVVQLRAKDWEARPTLALGERMLALARRYGVPFFLNDRPDLAALLGADGVHLGQDDLPISYARRLMGPGKIIGLSTHNAAQVREAVTAQPDYVGFGPIFSTSTKADHDPVVGLEGLRAARALTTLPMFAIGGITAESVGEIMAAGADGVAVISAILKAPDLGAAIRTFQQHLPTPDSQAP